jgi:NAD(P)-dependent dehydrogenase (short-subunit alcohol dehydrogenase family)
VLNSDGKAFEGRNVLITGSGGFLGKGMGRALALGFAERGARVVAVDRDAQALDDTAAKHGLVGLTKNVAVTHGPKGIRCVGVCPGSVRESPEREATAPAASPLHPGSWGEGWILKTKALMPRIGTPNEVVAAHLFLASDAASFINGSILVVDGGWTAA